MTARGGVAAAGTAEGVGAVAAAALVVGVVEAGGLVVVSDAGGTVVVVGLECDVTAGGGGVLKVLVTARVVLPVTVRVGAVVAPS